MRGMRLILRRLAAPCVAARPISANIIPSSVASHSTLILADRPFFPPSTASIADQGVFQTLSRKFSSSPSSDQSKVVLIESEEQFNDSLGKVQDGSLHAVFYFTAAWCPPCRLLSPIIVQLSEKYPNVTIYKVDIDTEGLGSSLNKLNINSVPTLHFFQDGKKASEVIGADVQLVKETMETLFK